MQFGRVPGTSTVVVLTVASSREWFPGSGCRGCWDEVRNETGRKPSKRTSKIGDLLIADATKRLSLHKQPQKSRQTVTLKQEQNRQQKSKQST